MLTLEEGKTLFEEMYQPVTPRASNLMSSGTSYYRRDEALGMRFIEVNKPQYKNILVLDFDVDHASRHVANLVADEVIPDPNILVTNPASGHVHASYILEVGASSIQSQRFFKDVQKKLAVISGADLAYNGMFTRNPLTHPVAFSDAGTYSLTGLAQFTKGVKIPLRKKYVGLGRNDEVFNTVRQYAYRIWNLCDGNIMKFREAVMEEALEMNESFDSPMTYAEVGGIVRSVIKWVESRFSKEKFSSLQAFRGRRSGAKAAAAADVRLDEVEAFMVLHETTFRVACDTLGYGYGTMRNLRSRRKAAVGKE